MITIRLDRASLATLLHDLNHASDHDLSATLRLDTDGVSVKIADDDWLPPVGSPPGPGPIPRTYVELSVDQTPFEELDYVHLAPTVVHRHDQGAWVQVPPLEPGHDALDVPTHPQWADYPNLHQLLLAAREIGAGWINLEGESTETFAHLPTFGWWNPPALEQSEDTESSAPEQLSVPIIHRVPRQPGRPGQGES